MDRRLKLFLGILMLACAVAGCVPLPQAKQSLAMRAPELVEVTRPTTSRQEEWPSGHWWEKFGDNQLNDFVTRALSANPSLDIARARLQAAIQTAQLAGARLGPSLTGSADVVREHFSGNGLIPPPFGGSNETEADLNLNFKYALDLWGKNRALKTSALDRSEAAAAERAAVELTLVTSVVQTYYAYQAEGRQLDYARQMADLQKRLVFLNRSRVEGGIAPITAMRQSERAWAVQQQAVRAIETSLAVIREELRALMGAVPNDLLKIQTGTLPDPNVALPPRLGLDLLARRPEIVASRWQVEAAMEEVRAAEAQFYPDLDIRALAGFSSLELGRLLNKDSRQGNVGAALHLPIFDAGRLKAGLGVSKAELDLAIARYNQALLEAVRDVARQAAAVEGLERQRVAQKEALAAEISIAAAAGARARQGLISEMDRLESELPVLARQDDALRLQARELNAKVALIQALGGGYHDESAVTIRLRESK